MDNYTPPMPPGAAPAAAPGAAPGMPSGTDKQYAAMLMMQNLSADEKQMAMQQAQASQLRQAGMQPSAKRDFGSQSARALQGIGGAIGDVQNQQMMDKYRQDSLSNQQKIQNILLGENGPPQPKPPLQTPPYTSGAAAGDGLE